MATNRRRSSQRPAPAADGNWVVPVWTLIAAAATIAIVVVAWLQWQTLSTIRQALNAAQRPWISAAVEPLQLAFDDKGGGLTLKITTKNNGAFPATDVLASPVLVLHDAKQPFNIRKACNQYGIAGGFGLTLFKGETYPNTSTAWVARADFGQSFPTLLAVCIKYRFADRSQAGETGYLFSIGRRSAARSDVNGIVPTNGSIDPPELALLPRGSYAN
jgi:hypothetical protein